MQSDWRNIQYGFEIPSEGYCDQPYIVTAKDGAWVCVMTTSRGEEGDRDQHIISARSKDRGKTWTDMAHVEPPGPPEASWATSLVVPSGRIYVFYTYNGDNLSRVITDPGYESMSTRVDTLGQMMMKYSDDNGKSWSKQRYQIPIRNFWIDEENPYQGKIQFFWSVAKPYIHNDGAVYIGCAKVGRFGKGFMARSEGIVLRSSNILTENDPSKIVWETLPEGKIGLRSVKGDVADEHNVTGLSDESLYCVYRTVAGHSCHSYSRDSGKTWTPPAYAVYEPGGRMIKHNRAASFVRRYSNGKYTLWLHNHGRDWTGAQTAKEVQDAYDDRNPVWMCGGVERDGYLYWSQPEVVLYDENPRTRISYPDFIEADEGYYISETQKTIARTHRIDAALFEGMWNSLVSPQPALDSIEFETGKSGSFPLQNFIPETDCNGFAFTMWLDTRKSGRGTLFSSCSLDGKGCQLTIHEENVLTITLSSRRARYTWDSDAGALTPGVHHVAVVVDDGPKIITFLVDGQLLDGGEQRQYGFGRFFCPVEDFKNKDNRATVDMLDGAVLKFRMYHRYLRNYEIRGIYEMENRIKER